MKLKLISCEVFYREMCAAISQSPNQVDIEFMPKGLHDLPCRDMRQRLQDVLDQVDAAKYEAVLFGYGLCNNGLHDLRAGAVPFVLPRAHDCMTLFMGSKERYLDYFQENPGVYFRTSGWIEGGEANGELEQQSIGYKAGLDQPYEELVKKYGEDNAQYLFDVLCNTKKHYRQLTYIEMGVEPDDRFEKHSQEEAQQHNFSYEKSLGTWSPSSSSWMVYGMTLISWWCHRGIAWQPSTMPE